MHIFDMAKDLPPWLMLGLGVLAGWLRSAWSYVYEHTVGYAITRSSLSLTVEDLEHDEAYHWLSAWVEGHLRGRKVNSLLLRRRLDFDCSDGPDSNFEIIPEYGTYYLKYQRRLMVVEHTKESQPNANRHRPTRSIRIRIWLSWDRRVLLDILSEARQTYEQNRPKRIDYYCSDQYGDWTSSSVSARSVNSLFHPPELLADLLNDVRTFLASKEMYADLGLPYRRGYLLAGPPGTGKSSLILAVASHFELPIYAVPLRGADITAERLAKLLAHCRKPALIALEDVDCMKVATSRNSNTQDPLTMADLLNTIDGIGASEDRVLFMTANHPEVLDPALTRAGRVDRKFFIDYARDEELRSFHERMTQFCEVRPWPEFRAALPARATIADAQALALQGRSYAAQRD